MTRAFFWLACLAGLLALPYVPPVTAQSPASIQLLTQLTLPESAHNKFPHIASRGDTIHIAGNADKLSAKYWTKQDAATSFGAPFEVGEARGKPDDNPAAVAVGPDGSVYVAWINLGGKDGGAPIYLRRRLPGGAWEPETRQVVGADRFRANVEVGVSSDNVVFVLWREPDGPFRYRYSGDSGVTWASGAPKVADVVGYGYPSIATGPGGQVVVAYTTSDYRIWAATWTGSGFVSTPVSDAPTSSSLHADPTATIGPDGQAYIAWRSLRANRPSLVYYAERQPNGSWPPSRLAEGGQVAGPVSIVADAANNVHLFWISDAPGFSALFYALKPAGQPFSGSPVQVSAGPFIANVRGAATVSTRSYGHAMVERFDGGVSSAHYLLFDAAAPNVLGASPLIEGGAAVTGKRTVAVRFTNVAGAPTQLRWRWSQPPTDALNDSGGWQPFASSIAVNVPAGLNADVCQPLTLYTQVRNDQGFVQQSQRDEIVLDLKVQANVGLVNPGVGDPAYTPLTVARLEVTNAGECSGLARATVGSQQFAITSNQLVTSLGLTTTQGLQTFGISVTDLVSNTAVFTRGITYDPTPPTLATTGTLTVTPRPEATILQTLELSGTTVTDNRYPAPGAWGVDITVSRGPTNPLTDTQLVWKTLPLAGLTRVGPPVQAGFRLEWSLGTSLPRAKLTPGEFYYYLRFRDGAGLLTSQYVEQQVTLATVTFPTIYLPVTRR